MECRCHTLAPLTFAVYHGVRNGLQLEKELT